MVFTTMHLAVKPCEIPMAKGGWYRFEALMPRAASSLKVSVSLLEMLSSAKSGWSRLDGGGDDLKDRE